MPDHNGMHFAVYTHKYVLEDGRLVLRMFIVLKDGDGDIVAFTNFHKFCRNSSRKIRALMETGGKRTSYVCQLLNYVYFQKYHIKCLQELTIDMVRDFLNAYGKSELPGDTKKRNAATVKICIRSILDFIINWSTEDPRCLIKKNDLVKTKTYRNAKGKIVHTNVLPFDVIYDPDVKVTFRDIPEKVFYIVLEEILKNHPEIMMPFALGAFAGLRPSEAMCVRREDSELGPGIIFSEHNGKTTSVTIDLTKEMNLRSDLTLTGRIKKERRARVYPAFLTNFMEIYNSYMTFIEGRNYEKTYGPLTLNRSGKAMTYASYSEKIRKVFSELQPAFLSDSDPEVVEYGKMLEIYNIGPHIFRHWFTIQLVLAGEGESAIMYWRGDKSPESARAYLSNKSALEKKYKIVSDEITEFNLWRTEKLYGKKH